MLNEYHLDIHIYPAGTVNFLKGLHDQLQRSKPHARSVKFTLLLKFKWRGKKGEIVISKREIRERGKGNLEGKFEVHTSICSRSSELMAARQSGLDSFSLFSSSGDKIPLGFGFLDSSEKPPLLPLPACVEVLLSEVFSVVIG